MIVRASTRVWVPVWTHTCVLEGSRAWGPIPQLGTELGKTGERNWRTTNAKEPRLDLEDRAAPSRQFADRSYSKEHECEEETAWKTLRKWARLKDRGTNPMASPQEVLRSPCERSWGQPHEGRGTKHPMTWARVSPVTRLQVLHLHGVWVRQGKGQGSFPLWNPCNWCKSGTHHLVLQFFLLSGESHVCLGDIFKFYFDD